MSESLLTILKLCLLVLLYLFFLRVLRAVWVEVRSPAPAVLTPGAAPRKRARRRERRAAVTRSGPRLVAIEPAAQRGVGYDVAGEVTLGRAANCRITVDDTFVSQLHARVFQRDGQVYVEDLGSTNGTYLNRRRVSGEMVMQRGDRLQVGNTIMELT